MSYIHESEFGYSEPQETKPSNIVRHGLKRFVKGSPGEIEWLSKAVSHPQTKQAVEMLYQCIPEVNLITQKRFTSLSLWHPRPLTIKNLYLFSASEFQWYQNNDRREIIHPAFKAFQESYKGDLEPDTTLASSRNDCIYWNVDLWLQSTNSFEVTTETLYHENTHRQCKRRYLQNEEADDIGKGLIIGLNYLSASLFNKDPDSEELPALDNYLEYIIDSFDQERCEFYIEGGRIYMQENGLLLCSGGGAIDETATYREADKINEIDSQNADDFQGEYFSEEDLLIVQSFYELDKMIKDLEEKHGEKTVMKAYFSGNLYNLILKDLTNEQRLQTLGGLLFLIL